MYQWLYLCEQYDELDTNIISFDEFVRQSYPTETDTTGTFVWVAGQKYYLK